MHATYVRAYDFHWGNEQLLHHFKSVVCHESTQYLINDANNRHLSYNETISLFPITAAQGAQDDKPTGKATRRRLHHVGVDDTLHQLYNAAPHEDLCIPNALWDELRRASPEIVTAINEARRRIQGKATSADTPGSSNIEPHVSGGGYAQRRQYGNTATANLIDSSSEIGGIICLTLIKTITLLMSHTHPQTVPPPPRTVSIPQMLNSTRLGLMTWITLLLI